MKQVKKTALAYELSDHVEEGLLLEVNADAHVQNYVRMAELVQHLNLLDEIFQSFSSHVPLAKLLDSDFGAHPPSLKDVAIATSTNQIIAWINL